jgi:hypothetical protein
MQVTGDNRAIDIYVPDIPLNLCWGPAQLLTILDVAFGHV